MYKKPSKSKYLVSSVAFVLIAISIVISGNSYIFGHTADLKGHQENNPVNLFYNASDLPGRQDLETVANEVVSIWNDKKLKGHKLPTRISKKARVVYAALRSKGRRMADAWGINERPARALMRAINCSKANLSDEEASKIDTIEIAFCHSFRKINPKVAFERTKLLSNIHRGVNGLEISYHDNVERFTPTYAIASNRSNKRLIKLFKIKHGLTKEEMKNKVRYRIFEGEQILVKLGEKCKAHLMERGNNFVPISNVTQENTRKLADLASEWIFNNIHKDGRLTYKYYPSTGRESASNNMIRQWLATVALEQVATEINNTTIWNIIEKNIDYNLRHFYREDGKYGLIAWNNKIKLGALAVATMALIMHPNRDKWSHQEAALLRTINFLWNKDGSFTTFFKPKGRTDNQNFYPGETLLLWAILYEHNRDERLLKRFMKSFKYYQNWHLNIVNRNPAFIPWHTQACYKVWKQTRDKNLKNFIFEMNDWLLNIQQWHSDVCYRDAIGRFYDPKRPFGPPHSSSTGVYLEGLIDAFRLARATGDERRINAYRIAIIRGLRSIMQLQFVDEIDMFYVSQSKCKYVYGGIRTTVYDNQIRCDNIQHNLMGALKILRTFNATDYSHGKKEPHE